MQFIIFLLYIFFTLLFPIFSSHELFAMADVGPNIGSRLTLATGHDSVSDTTGDECVVKEEAESIDGNIIASTTAEMIFIDNLKKLGDSLDISASTNLKLGFGAGRISGTVKFFKEHKFDDRSVYFMIKITVSTPILKMKRTKLQEEYVKLLKTPNGAREFRERCGDEFVIGIQRGGFLYALFKIEATSEGEKQEISSSIRGRIDLTKVSGESELAINSAFSKILSQYKTEVYFHQEGGLVDQIPLDKDTFEKMKEIAKNFSANIRHYGGITVLAITQPYKKLFNYPLEASPIRVTNQIQIVKRLSDERYNALEEIDKIEHYINNSKLYLLDNELIIKLNRVRNQLAFNLEIITQLADDCFYDIDKCRLPKKEDGFVLEILPEVSFREKENGGDKADDCVEWEYQEGIGEICGVESFKKERNILCGVELASEGNGIVCGVNRYIRKRDKICGVEKFKNSKHPKCGKERVEQFSTFPSCLERGFDDGSVEYLYSPGGRSGEGAYRIGQILNCYNFKSCRVEENGVEEYVECEHPSFGYIFNSCRHESFGIERYRECANELFGMIYKKCRHELFGVERCLKKRGDVRSDVR